VAFALRDRGGQGRESHSALADDEGSIQLTARLLLPKPFLLPAKTKLLSNSRNIKLEPLDACFIYNDIFW